MTQVTDIPFRHNWIAISRKRVAIFSCRYYWKLVVLQNKAFANPKITLNIRLFCWRTSTFMELSENFTFRCSVIVRTLLFVRLSILLETELEHSLDYLLILASSLLLLKNQVMKESFYRYDFTVN